MEKFISKEGVIEMVILSIDDLNPDFNKPLNKVNKYDFVDIEGDVFIQHIFNRAKIVIFKYKLITVVLKVKYSL